MGRLLAIAAAVITDAVRRKVVWLVLLFSALLAFVIPSLPSYGVGVVAAVYREVSIALMFVAGLTVGLALACTRVPSEVERRTVFTVLARDVSRWQYVAATWVGMLGVVGLVLACYTAVAIVIGFFVYHQVMLVLLEATLAVWLESGVVMAMAMLVASRFTAVTNLVAAFTFVFIGHSMTSFVGGAENAASLWWLPSLDAFNVINQVAHGGGYGPIYALSMLGVFAGWSAVLLAIASALFTARDL